MASACNIYLAVGGELMERHLSVVNDIHVLTSEVSCQGAPIAWEPLVGCKDDQISNPPGPDSQEPAHNQQYEHQQQQDEYNTACIHTTWIQS